MEQAAERIARLYAEAEAEEVQRRRGVVPDLFQLSPTDVGSLLSDHDMKPIRWIWRGRLAHGMLTMLDGDPELGKSTLVADMTARITTGKPWPDGGLCEKGGVIVVGSEDSIEQVLKPRMVAAGADPIRVLSITLIDGVRGQRLPSLPEDLPLFEAAIERMQAHLLVFDPIMPYISTTLNTNSDQQVRQAITPLVEMLDRTGCACLALRHLSKNDRVSNAIYRGLGSIAFNGVARLGLSVAKDKEVEGERIFMVHMNNIGLKPKARRYRFEEVDLGGGIITSRITWGEESDHQADEVLTAFGHVRPRMAATELLQRLLAEGPVDSKIVFDEADENHIAVATLKRAKKELRVIARRVGFGEAGRWTWELPAEGNQAPKGDQLPKGINNREEDQSLNTKPQRVSIRKTDPLSSSYLKGDQMRVSDPLCCPRCGKSDYQPLGEGRRKCHACGHTWVAA